MQLFCLPIHAASKTDNVWSLVSCMYSRYATSASKIEKISAIKKNLNENCKYAMPLRYFYGMGWQLCIMYGPVRFSRFQFSCVFHVLAWANNTLWNHLCLSIRMSLSPTGIGNLHGLDRGGGVAAQQWDRRIRCWNTLFGNNNLVSHLYKKNLRGNSDLPDVAWSHHWNISALQRVHLSCRDNSRAIVGSGSMFIIVIPGFSQLLWNFSVCETDT
jgi:hypothetical protein